MFPPLHIPGEGPSSPGAPRLPPRLLENLPVNLPTSWSHNPPPEPPFSPRRKPLINLPITRFQLPAELPVRDVKRITDLSQLPEISKDNCDAEDESNDLSELGSTEGKPPMNQKQTKFSKKQFAKIMAQATHSTFHKQQKVYVAGTQESKHQSGIRGQKCRKHI
jgi:hypothetical protein